MIIKTTFYTALLFFCFCNVCSAANVTGTVTSENGDSLSFVNIFIKGTQIGTSSNELGYFELNLPPGNYVLVFQYIGYKQQEVLVNVGSSKQYLHVVLKQQSYALKEVAVNATAEDPAYPIMRMAIAHAKIYNKEIKSFECKVYMKAMQRLTTVPKRVALIKVPENIKPGIIYLSESVSELFFTAPDKINERMISSKVSGASKAFSFNRAGSVKFSLYEPIVPSFGLNERGFVSPLSSNAFFYYKFKLEGSEEENGLTIYKIKLIPIRAHDPVFNGHIYIIKDLWRLHSTDLIINKQANIEFVDELLIKQNYTPLSNGMWLPTAQRFIFNLEVFGFKGNGYFVVIYSNYKAVSNYSENFYTIKNLAVNNNEPVPQVKKITKIKVASIKKETAKQTRLASNAELLSVDEMANKTPDSVWENIRPIPLTDEEVADYRKGDSIETVKESVWYKDSVDKIANRFDVLNYIISGYRYNVSKSNISVLFEPMFNGLQFNTVEGWLLNLPISINKRINNGKQRLEIVPHLRYGFERNQAFALLQIRYVYNNIKLASIGVNGGSMVEQFNGNNPISPLVNTAYTLLAKQNFMKIYQSDFIEVYHKKEWFNGFFNTISVKYQQRIPMQNLIRFDTANRNRFSINNPLNIEQGFVQTITHNALLIDMGFKITPGQKYLSRPTYRYRIQGKWPVFTVNYTKAIPVLNAVVSYDKLEALVEKSTNLDLFGEFNWQIKGGNFLTNNRVDFIDYFHFNGNQTLFMGSGFQLLDYYMYSTGRSYVSGKIEQNFNGFVFNKIPVFRKLKLQEVLGFSALQTSRSPFISEINAGIEHIFKILRVDFVTQFINQKHNASGIRFGFGF